MAAVASDSVSATLMFEKALRVEASEAPARGFLETSDLAKLPLSQLLGSSFLRGGADGGSTSSSSSAGPLGAPQDMAVAAAESLAAVDCSTDALLRDQGNASQQSAQSKQEQEGGGLEREPSAKPRDLTAPASPPMAGGAGAGPGSQSADGGPRHRPSGDAALLGTCGPHHQPASLQLTGGRPQGSITLTSSETTCGVFESLTVSDDGSPQRGPQSSQGVEPDAAGLGCEQSRTVVQEEHRSVAIQERGPFCRGTRTRSSFFSVDSQASLIQGLGMDSEESGSDEEEGDTIWPAIREQAHRDAEAEPVLASYLHATILAHFSLESALASHLANKLASPTLLSCHLVMLIREVLQKNPCIIEATRKDLRAVKARDPACDSYLHCLLNFKGFAALQAHRVAHELWATGRKALAMAVHSRSCECFHVDIHPAAQLGSGLLLDHATGIVIGETAVVGDNVSMLHNVTLGGSGVSSGPRHPIIEDGVFLGAGARVLGRVRMGKGAKVGAASVVISDVSSGATVVGNPAREVRRKIPPKPPLEPMADGAA